MSAADIGVYGQSLAVSPSPLPASPGTGIFGTGDNIGVLGESARGRGVIGNSVSAAEIGVYGQSLAVSPSPCRPVRVKEYSGQVTTLALRGRAGAARRCIYHWIANTSASRSGAIGSSRTAASQCRNPSAPPFDPPPQLPRLGRAGDVLAATVQIDEVNIARLWFCAIGNRNPACALGRDFVQPNDSGYQPVRNQPARYPGPGMGSGLSGMRNIVRKFYLRTEFGQSASELKTKTIE